MRPRSTDRERVIAAAARCFGERGIGGTSVADISAEAGVSRVTVYRHGGTKAEITAAVLATELAGLVTDMREAVEAATSAREIVALTIRSGLEGVRTRPVFARAVGPDLRQTLEALTIDSAELMGAGIAAATEMVGPQARRFVPGITDDELRLLIEETGRWLLGLLHTPRTDPRLAEPEHAAALAVEIYGPFIDALAARRVTIPPPGDGNEPVNVAGASSETDLDPA